MKKILLSFLTFMLCIGVNAEVLNVWKTNGDRVSYDFSKKPEITYSDGLLFVTTTMGTDSYSPDELSKFTFEEGVADGIQNAQLPGTHLLVNEKAFVVSGLEAGVTVQLIDAAGRKVVAVKASANGVATIPVKRVPKGVNIIKAGSSTYKIMKR